MLYWLNQVSVKLPLLIVLGLAFTVPLLVAMVIGSMPGVDDVSTDPFTLAELNPTCLKSASGSTPPLLEGASAITSAEPSFADLSRAEVLCVHPFVLSVSVSWKLPAASLVTVALMLSPGATGLE